jgi:hypothetical protein
LQFHVTGLPGDFNTAFGIMQAAFRFHSGVPITLCGFAEGRSLATSVAR